MRKVWYASLSLATLLSAAGCDNSSGQSAAAAPSGGRGGRGDPNRIIPVEVAIATRGSITRTIALSGVVEPIRRVGVNSQLSGALLSINVEEGKVVRQGDVLALLDARELQLQLTGANAALTAAKSTMDRAEKMRKAQIYTDIEYDRDRTALASAQSQRDQLEARLAYATVKSPLDGVVIEKRVEAGDVVGVQTRLFQIADVSTLVVRVNVSELEVAGLSQGQSVDIAVDAMTGDLVRGRIRRIFPSADSATRLVPVEVELTGANVRNVKPGYLARATFHSVARSNALLIPESSVIGSAGAQVVMMYREGAAERRTVRTGMSYAGKVEIVDGLKDGDTVIVAGNNALRDGARVRIVTGSLGDIPPSAPTGDGRGGDEQPARENRAGRAGGE